MGKELSRRGFLAASASAALTAAGCASEPPRPGPPAGPPPAKPAALTSAVTVERVVSAARNQTVDLVFMVPEGVPATDLPVCLALHGRGASARNFLTLGLPEALTRVVKDGTPPFAVVAIDGDHYWLETEPGDDPQRMLSAELPGWLSNRNLKQPSAVFGISMGAFGALRYARDHRDLRAAAACSPALFTSWGDAKARKMFESREQWEANEPLRHLDELKPVPVGVWCGNGDPFAKAARKLAEGAAPVESTFAPGGHTEKYWKQVMPDIMAFTGRHLRR